MLCCLNVAYECQALCRLIRAQRMVPWTGENIRHNLQPEDQVEAGGSHLGSCTVLS